MSLEDNIKIKDFNFKPKELLHFREIFGLFETVSSEPNGKPKRFHNQIKIYKSGDTRRIYWYDTTNDEWVYVAGTAA